MQDKGIYYLNGTQCSNILLSIIWGLQQDNGEKLVRDYLLEVCKRSIRFYAKDESENNSMDRTYIIGDAFQLKLIDGVWCINSLNATDDTTQSPIIELFKFISMLREPYLK